MMPLVMADMGEPQIIKKIGGSPEVKKHLEDLGFNVGGEVEFSYNFAGMEGFNVMPCLGWKWVF